MTESILNTTKTLLGIAISDTAFDAEIVTHINSAFMVLNQLGVGPADPFMIEDHTTEWSSFSVDLPKMAAVKTYIFQKVRMMFDPPTLSFVLDALKNQINELEFRLAVQTNPYVMPPVVPEEE